MFTPDPVAIQAADDLAATLADNLPAVCRPDFIRLTRTVLHGPTFQWLLIDAPDDRLRDRVLHALERVLRAARMDSSRLPLASLADVPDFERQLVTHAKGCPVVHVMGRRDWFDAKRWDAFNVRRERIAANARARLLFWLDAEAIAEASRGAPDLWAWRSGVYEFREAVATTMPLDRSLPRVEVTGSVGSLDTRPLEERLSRIREIREWIDTHQDAGDDQRVGPFDELGRLLESVGQFDDAVSHWQDAELPLHDRRGDERAVAITMGKIANVLQARGQLDEALRIRKDEELPVFERLGDARSRAITMGNIADILQARGQLDEAMRILEDEALPVFERLGDVRARAVTIGNIADILQARGQLDEALRVRKDELLPVFERLGDVHSRAITMGKIADVLQARGQLDEALRIRKDEELPVFERLGDVRSLLVARANLALNLAARDRNEDKSEIQTLLNQALTDAHRLGVPEAAQIEAHMRRLVDERPDAAAPPSKR